MRTEEASWSLRLLKIADHLFNIRIVFPDILALTADFMVDRVIIILVELIDNDRRKLCLQRTFGGQKTLQHIEM